MKRLALLTLLAAPVALAQDALKAAPDHYKVLVDNAQVRVIQNTLKPGEKDGTHTHPAGWFYVTQGGKMKVVAADGKVEMWEPKTGDSGWMEAEGKHTSENVGTAPMSFILVEVKSAATSSAR
jgi:quercetin dioxygenase-like cupin family protein